MAAALPSEASGLEVTKVGFRNCHLMFASLGSSSLSTVVLRVAFSEKVCASRRGSDLCPACSFCGGGFCACRMLPEAVQVGSDPGVVMLGSEDRIAQY